MSTVNVSPLQILFLSIYLSICLSIYLSIYLSTSAPTPTSVSIFASAPTLTAISISHLSVYCFDHISRFFKSMIPNQLHVSQMVKNLPAMLETQFNPWDGKIPWRREWQPTPVSLPGESHRQRSLAIVHGVTKSQT